MNRRQFGGAVLGSALASTGESLALRPSIASASTAGARWSVMLWTILPNEPFERRLEVALEAGFRSIELNSECDHWSARQFADFRRTRDAHRFTVDAIAFRPGILSYRNNPDKLLTDLERRIEAAKSFGCSDLIVLSGDQLPNVSAIDQQKTMVDLLSRGGDLAGRNGCRLLLESLDPEEEPRFFVNSVAQSCEIVRSVGHAHVRVLYDFYHEQIAHGNLIKKINDNFDLISLIHVADVPGRHEPGTGEIDYGQVLRRLGQLGYSRSDCDGIPSNGRCHPKS